MHSVLHKRQVQELPSLQPTPNLNIPKAYGVPDRKPRSRDPIVPQAYSVPDAATVLAISKTNAYDLIKRGLLPARKIGSRTVVTHEELMHFLENAPRR